MTDTIRRQALAIFEKAQADGNVQALFEETMIELARKTAAIRSAGILEDRRNPSNPAAEAMHEIAEDAATRAMERFEARVREIVAESAKASTAASEAAVVRLLKRIGLNTDDDEFDDTAAKLRAALNFPSSAWGFTKWVGATLGSATLGTIAVLLLAMFGMKKP